MKKFTLVGLIIVLIVIFVGCIEFPSTGILSLNISIPSANSRFSTISPDISIEHYLINFDSFNGYSTEKESIIITEEISEVSLSVGTWNISIYAEDSEGAMLANAVLEDVEIVKNNINSVEAVLQPAAGTGSLTITLDLSAKPADVTISSVEYRLEKGVSSSVLVESGILYAPYILSLDCASGSDYKLIFEITTDSGLNPIITEGAVHVFAGKVTTGAIVISSAMFGGQTEDLYIANHLIAKESVLRAIPESAIIAAKNKLHIMYCGTSHSSQTVDGMRGLIEYKAGDDSLYAVTFDGEPELGSLDIDYRPTSPINVYSASDLSNDGMDNDGHTQYFYRTIEYLDHSDHADVNVVMWSWCSIEGHDVQRYLDNFSELINMYKAGGPKGRITSNEVTFVMMTGYARGSDADTPEPPYIKSPFQNHKRIVNFSEANDIFCLDYWSQDVYNYGDDYYKPEESGNENFQHYEWVNDPDNTLGTHWFETRSYSSGTVIWPAHCDGTYPQHLTSNRRAYAAWWIWARIAGWEG